MTQLRPYRASIRSWANPGLGLLVGLAGLLVAGCAARLPIQVLGLKDQPIDLRFTPVLSSEFERSSRFRIARAGSPPALTATVEDLRPIPDGGHVRFHWVIRVARLGVPLGTSEGDCTAESMTACAKTIVGDTQFFAGELQSAGDDRQVSASQPLLLTDDEAAKALRVIPPGKPLREFYPDVLRRQRIQGKVLCRVTIDAHGRVVDAEVVNGRSTDRRLGTAALRLARAYQFDNPLHRAVVTTLPVKFSIAHAPEQVPN